MQQSTLLCGLIGENIGRSRLEMALELFCQQSGRSLEFKAFDTADAQDFGFAGHIRLLHVFGYQGISVTHPWKTLADCLCDQRDGYPAGLGACNLLRFETDGIRGFNTDFTGMVATWKARFGDASPGKVAIAGAGGVARAIVSAMVDCGAEKISIWDRNPQAAQRLAADLGSGNTIVRAVDISQARDVCARADGLINATPLGMREYPGTAFDPVWWGKAAVWAFDAVYTPIETDFLRAAACSGLRCISGFDLFRHMAARSFAAYTGTETDPDAADLLLPLGNGV